MIIGCDLDGTITLIPFNNTQIRLPWFFATWMAFVPPNIRMVKTLMRRVVAGDTIIIVSSRPQQLKGLSVWQLKLFGVPFSDLVLVGVGGDPAAKKLAVIRERGIEAYVDDYPLVRQGLKERGFVAVFSPQEFLLKERKD